MKYVINLICILYICPVFSLPWDNIHAHTTVNKKTSYTERVLSIKTKNLFKWMNNVNTKHALLTRRNFEKFFSEDIQYSINGILAASDGNELFSRFERMIHLTKNFKIRQPLKAMVVNQDQVAVTYEIDITDNNKRHYRDLITTFIRYKNGKIDHWNALIQHIQ